MCLSINRANGHDQQGRASSEVMVATEETRSVVVVDDDQLMVALMVEGLRSGGLSVEGRQTVQEAETLLVERSCDLLIVDQTLSRENEGIELLERAASEGWCRRSLLISGYPRGSGTDDRLSPETRFLQKPFRLPVLLDLCSELLDQGR